MALNDENGGLNVSMPVAPAYGGMPYGGYNNGFGGFGGDWSWIILLLLVCGGGWGGIGGFGGGFGGMYEFPWLLNAQNMVNANTNAGFDHAATQSAIGDLSNAVTSGFGNVQTALCGGFAGVNATVNGTQNAISQQLYTNQISDLERSFAAQTASSQGMSAIQAQLAQCCCDNRAAVADLKYTVATEACADRNAISNALRDVLTANTASTQRILDQLCSDKIDAKNEKIADLERQLTMANLAASQGAQTSRILADNAAQTSALEQYLAPTPRPAWIVQNPNCCAPNYGCGCGVA